MEFICSKCGKRAPASTRDYHCKCGGLWQLDFHPPKFDLAQVDKEEWSQYRYRKFMAIEDDSWKEVSLGEGMTPIVRLDDDILLKLDYCMPTLSFKDRGRRPWSPTVNRLGWTMWLKTPVGMRGMRSQPIAVEPA